METTFKQVPIGARFEFRGRRYVKMNSEIGRDEDRGGNVFHRETEVSVEAVPPLARARVRSQPAPVVPTFFKDLRDRVPDDEQRRINLELLRGLMPEGHWKLMRGEYRGT